MILNVCGWSQVLAVEYKSFRSPSHLYQSKSNLYLSEDNLYISEGNLYLSEGNLDLSQVNLYLSEGNLYLSEGNLYLSERNLYQYEKSPMTVQQWSIIHLTIWLTWPLNENKKPCNLRSEKVVIGPSDWSSTNHGSFF